MTADPAVRREAKPTAPMRDAQCPAPAQSFNTPVNARDGAVRVVRLFAGVPC